MIAKLVEKNQITDEIFQLKCVVEDYDNWQIQAGQYVIVEKTEGEQKVRRAYSISSLPGDLPSFELTIRLYPEGKVSSYLTGLNIGDTLVFNGPFGNFGVNRRKENNVVLLAIGCGIAPLKAMVLQWLNQKEKIEIKLFFGNRYIEQIPYDKLFQQLNREHNNFFYYPCISKLTESTPGYYSGRVNQVMEKEIRNFRERDYFICGSQLMLEDMKDFLERKGVREGNIFFEKVVL